MLQEVDPRVGKHYQDFMHDVGDGVGGIIRHWNSFQLRVARQMLCRIHLAFCSCGLGLDSGQKTVTRSQFREQRLALGRHAELQLRTEIS